MKTLDSIIDGIFDAAKTVSNLEYTQKINISTEFNFPCLLNYWNLNI